MTYRIIDGTNHKYNIEEKDTGQIVWSTNKSQEARTLTRKLNLGSGFAGYTPAFFNAYSKQKERPTE